MQIKKREKPLGRKAYGSIGHLPNSRLGPKDYCIPDGQARIATQKRRDKHDVVIVQEKLDGSCVSAAMLEGQIIALGRAGYPANTSPFIQHHWWADWVAENETRFRAVLNEGERIVGEWLAQAHGTIYEIDDNEPFGAFDIMTGTTRLCYHDFLRRVRGWFKRPHTLSIGHSISVEEAMAEHSRFGWQCDEPEGVVYRVERNRKVDFLCKWVRPDKIDGKYLPEISGCDPVFNWQPTR